MTSWGGGAQAGRHGAIGPETKGIHPTNEQRVGECAPNASIGSRTPPLLTTTMSQTPYYIGIDVEGEDLAPARNGEASTAPSI